MRGLYPIEIDTGFSSSHLSDKLTRMISCVIKTVYTCAKDDLPVSIIDGIVRKKLKENSMSFLGQALEVPSILQSSLGSLCSSSLSADANNCIKTFLQKLTADKTDPSLCR